MRFLIDACLPREFATVLASYGHVSTDVRDIGMGRSADTEIAEFAAKNQLCLLTEDWGFSDIRVYPPDRFYGIVVFETVDNRIQEKLSTLRNLLEKSEVTLALPKRLAIVTPYAIRLRPPL